MTSPYWTATETCKGCGRPSVARSYLCEDCRRLMQRVETRKDAEKRGRKVDKESRLRALSEQWDGNSGCFRCHFTDVPLTGKHGETNYPTWEHLTPGDESSVRLVADLVNRMKADMTEEEFRGMVIALAAKFKEGQFDESVFPKRNRRTGQESP